MFETAGAARDAPILHRRYAVFGHPIVHSRSPFIHARFAAQTGIALSYSAIDAAPEAFPSALAAFDAGGGLGANVTLPLKTIATRLCSELSPSAQRSGSTNTLIRRGGDGWRGDNTDGRGLVADIAERHRLDLRGRRVLVLGAGGAVQGVLDAILDSGVDQLVIANRSPEKADALVDRIGEPTRVHSAYWSDLGEAGAFDLILNGTSAGHSGIRLALPFSLATRRTLAYDMNYGKAAIEFLAWGRAAGCEHVIDGTGMLVEQAAESFLLWHGVRPETDPVYAALREELAP
jgi:shikimate dehydrogenase